MTEECLIIFLPITQIYKKAKRDNTNMGNFAEGLQTRLGDIFSSVYHGKSNQGEIVFIVANLSARLREKCPEVMKNGALEHRAVNEFIAHELRQYGHIEASEAYSDVYVKRMRLAS